MTPTQTRESILREVASMGPTQAAVRVVQEALPDCQQGVDEWLDVAADISYRHTFSTVATAVLNAGFEVHADYLRRAPVWAQAPFEIMVVGWHAAGNPAEVLLDESVWGKLTPELAVACGLTAGRLIRERGAEVPVERAWNLARRIFRTSDKSDQILRTMLLGLVDHVQEPDLLRGSTEFVRGAGAVGKEFRETALAWRTSVFDGMDRPPIEVVGETYALSGERGKTVRRPTKKVGRNDPCHCGSGRKYKKCCEEKDRARARLASGVAGKTLEELEREKERHLTAAAMERLSAAELARYDPTRVKPGLHFPLLQRLCKGDQAEAAARLLLEVPWQEEFQSAVSYVGFLCARQRKPDAMRRLIDGLGERLKGDDGRYPAPMELMLAEGDHEHYLDLLRRYAEDAVDDPEKLQWLAFSLLPSPLPHLGIIVARIALLLTDEPTIRRELTRDLVYARDTLKLPYRDLSQDLTERLFEEDEDAGSEEEADLREAMASLRATERRLREELAEQKRQMRLAERRSVREAERHSRASSPVADGTNPETVRELRSHRDAMKEMLKRVQAERTGLRRRLDEALQASRRPEANEAEPAGPERGEEDHDQWEPVVTSGKRPLCLPVFEKHFRDALRKLAPRVVRTGLKRVGLLAAGEASVFVGEKRLKENREYLRIGVEKDYRLIYRYRDESLEVEDLVHRSKLDETVKRLRDK